jgi:hypothetical protein
VTAPDYAAAIVGWRSWTVLETPDGWRLCSPAFTTLWPPGAGVVAACKHLSWTGRVEQTAASHEAPYESCGCGIYASKTASGAASFLIDHAMSRLGRRQCAVFGRVSLWGRVVEAEYGWRGELAYPERLYLLEERPDQAGAPVVRMRRLVDSLRCYGLPLETFAAERLLEFARAR